MAETIESFGENGICAVCKRKPVSKWCDYVTGYENSTLFLRNYKDFISANSGNDYTTCDLPMCNSCATSVGRDRDLCPHHMSLHRQKELPNKYQRQRQMQEKVNVLGDNK